MLISVSSFCFFIDDNFFIDYLVKRFVSGDTWRIDCFYFLNYECNWDKYEVDTRINHLMVVIRKWLD